MRNALALAAGIITAAAPAFADAGDMTASGRILPAFAALSLAAAIWAPPALAAETTDYTDAAFAAEKTGQAILIDTFATWCDICSRQKRSSAGS